MIEADGRFQQIEAAEFLSQDARWTLAIQWIAHIASVFLEEAIDHVVQGPADGPLSTSKSG